VLGDANIWENMKTRLILLFIAAFALYCVISCSGSKEAASDKEPAANGQAATTQTAPVISFNANDTKGQSRSSDEWLGKKPVVLNFWGTWCPPCRREIPDLVRLYKEYEPKGIEMIGFAVKDVPMKAQLFANEANMGWVMLMANDKVLNDYNIVNGIPTTIFLDKNGREMTRFIGPRDYETFKQAFEAILK
jgi:thiol-disulfide isomerase/thioredoxin